ncbi:MAG TPA: DinB family protein [Bryobacteraceae bacterium]|nr:DinB family protein [Bryobacteraceae bacterium]
MSTVEPWLRGGEPGVHPLIAAALFAFEQAREDLAQWTQGMTEEQMWARPHGLAPVAFQIRHIAGSVERLTTYLEGRQLSAEQIAAAREEETPAPLGRDQLLALLEHSLRGSEAVFRALDPATLAEPREVGRKRLPTTVAGLLVHIAEHTARHVGEAIITTRVARAS